MKQHIWTTIAFFLLMNFAANELSAQNRSFILNLSLGVGNSGFKIEEANDGDEVRRIYYPMGGIQIQKRLSPKWALNVFPNVGMSGNRSVLGSPIGNITEVKSTSAFLNLGIHPKYYLNDLVYFSLGPEVSYLIWNYGSTYNEDSRLSNREETEFFNRTNLLLSSSLGLSIKIEESRKNAPVQIDALWYLELRFKKGITNILNENTFGNELSSTVSAFEIVTGISFSSQK